jgi:hypothetical protein
MNAQAPPIVRPRGNRRVLVLGLVGLLAVAAVAGGWAGLWLSAHDVSGLEGTWRDTNDPRHCYEFRRNGEVATWSGSKEWWNRIGWSATWRRDGQQITIRTDRNWDFVGRLDGDVIRGKMIMRDQDGSVAGEAEVVWQRE